MLLNRASNDFERQLIAQTHCQSSATFFQNILASKEMGWTKPLSEIDMTRKVYSGKDSKTPLK